MTIRRSTARHFAPRAGAVLASLAAVAATALSVVPASSASARHAHIGASHGHSAGSLTPVVLQWYDITNSTITDAAFAQPVTGSNAWDVSWVAAAHAASGSRNPDYQVAAFTQALHDALVSLVPSQASALDSDLATTLATIPDGPAKSAGIAAGQQQAAAEIAARQNDGLDTASVDTPFTPPPPAPGVWQPTPPAFGPAVRAGEGNATSFLLTANNQFDPGPPPSLTSQTYLQSLAETESYGAVDSTVRTPQETDVALFWEPAINIQYIEIVRAIVADTNHSLGWDTRFVAAFQVVTTDAQIAIYNTKYKYVRWRPVTAIREGSPGVTANPTWTPYFTTPSFPEYPSGHAGYAGAAQQVLTAFVGPFAPAPISVTSPTDPGSTHVYTNWAQVTQEVINARVWEGVHFRFSDNTGAKEGAEVAGYELPRLGSLGLY
jgi:PAP2 superfamily